MHIIFFSAMDFVLADLSTRFDDSIRLAICQIMTFLAENLLSKKTLTSSEAGIFCNRFHFDVDVVFKLNGFISVFRGNNGLVKVYDFTRIKSGFCR